MKFNAEANRGICDYTYAVYSIICLCDAVGQ